MRFTGVLTIHIAFWLKIHWHLTLGNVCIHMIPEAYGNNKLTCASGLTQGGPPE